MSRALLYNSLSGSLLFITNILIAFIMTPILIHALGNRDYGLWELVMSVMGYMGLLDLGVGGSLVRFVSVADGRKDIFDLQKTISTAFVFFLCIGAISVLLLLFLGFFPNIIGGEVGEITSLGTVLFLIALNAAFLFPMKVFVATLMGVQRHFYINNVRMVLTVLQALVLYLVFKHSHFNALVVLALLTPVFTGIQLALFSSAVVFDKKIPAIKLSSVCFSKVKEMASFAGKSAIMLVAGRLQNQSVPIIISHVIGLSYIVYFVIPNRLIDYARGFSLAIGFPLTPYFGAAVGRGESDELVDSWLNTSLALQVVTLAVPIVILFTGVPFIQLWIGNEYAVAGQYILYFLIAGLFADALATNSFRVLTALARHGKCATMWLILATASIPLGITGAYQFGLTGVVVGTTMVAVVANLLTLMMACSELKVGITQYLRHTTFKLMLPLFLMAIVFAVFHFFVPIINYAYLILHVMVSGSVYVVCLWFFTLTTDQKIYIYNKFREYRNEIKVILTGK